LCIASEGLGLESLERSGAALDRGVGLRSAGGLEVVAAVDLGQPRTEALQVGLGFFDFLIGRAISIALAAQLVEEGGNALEHFAVLVVASRLKLGHDPRLLVGILEGNAQHSRCATVGANPVGEPANLALDVRASRQHTHGLVQVEGPERAQLAPDRNTERIGGAGARRRHQQPRLVPGVLVVRHDATSVSRTGYDLSTVASLPGTETLLRRGLALEYATLSWNVVGTVVVIIAALSAGSVALAGFGLDSLIEIGASTIVVWQLKDAGATRERPALRLIGIGFIALAIYIAAQAAHTLISADHPEHSTLGIAWTAVTCAVMLALAGGKARTGRALGNRVLETEARVTLVDAYLAAAVLLGLAANAVLDWWWADPLAGLVIVYYGLREGRQALRASHRQRRIRHRPPPKRPRLRRAHRPHPRRLDPYE
jgi:Cation efflux family